MIRAETLQFTGSVRQELGVHVLVLHGGGGGFVVRRERSCVLSAIVR